MLTEDPEPDYCSRADAAAVLKCSVQTIDRRVREGVLTAHRMGPRSVRLDMREVRALVTPTAPDGAELSAEAEADWIRRCVDRAPELSPARLAQLRAVLTSGGAPRAT